jgi:Uncharacterized protein conserved in bacteria
MDDKKKNSSFNSVLEAFAFIPQISFTIVTPIILGALAGHWLDGKLGTGMIFLLILLCLGIAGGFYGAYRQMTILGGWKKQTEKKQPEKKPADRKR